MRYTPSGQSVTSFSIASNRKYTTATGERREETEWFNVSVWGKMGESCNQYLTKGSQVYVEGRLHSRTYQARDGQTRFVNEITVTDIQFLGRPGGGIGAGDSPYDGNDSFDSPPNDDIDDLPF